LVSMRVLTTKKALAAQVPATHILVAQLLAAE
jgi:hypothetical protein